MPFVITLATLAITLAATAAAYSIVGLRQFAAGAPMAVTVLGGAVEVSALVVAAWLHATWSHTPRWMRASGILFVLAIMCLTSLGIFSFLIAAHGSQAAHRDSLALAQHGIEDRLAIHRQALDDAQKEELGLQAQYSAYLQAGKVSRSVATRQADQAQLDELRQRMESERTAIEQLEAQRIDAQASLNGATIELGPVKALAGLIGRGEDDAVNLFIALLMLPFDPLAVWLAVAASHANKMRHRRLADQVAHEADEPAAGEPAETQPIDPAPGESSADQTPIKNRGGRPKGRKDSHPRKRPQAAGEASAESATEETAEITVAAAE
ncbi:MAG TPA: hypothetical protein VN809_14995 [Telmatospirillum sp.]|nr:hypothetical protein [Telmatospirillum sp.]